MTHPSLFEAVIEKASIGYRYRIEKNGEILVPFDSTAGASCWAWTHQGARRKAADCIERMCAPPQPAVERIAGDKLVEQVQIERFAESMIL